MWASGKVSARYTGIVVDEGYGYYVRSVTSRKSGIFVVLSEHSHQ